MKHMNLKILGLKIKTPLKILIVYLIIKKDKNLGWYYLLKVICSETKNTNANYKMIIKTKEGNEYKDFIINIQNGKLKIENYLDNVIFAGDENYYKHLENIIFDLSKNLNNLSKDIEIAVLSLIKLKSIEPKYQTVGTNDKGEIQIEIFK